MYKLLHPTTWTDYELIDSGDFQKLERFGKYTLARPEPQAVWSKNLTEQEWQKRADATYIREKGSNEKLLNSERGQWQLKGNVPDNWMIAYKYKDISIRLKVALTSFGHIGVFPEQAENWNFIYDTLKGTGIETPRVLNLFAYTGAASLIAKVAGADVTHVDSIKATVSWSRGNMEASGLRDIRWVIEDAMKYVRREVKRGNTYNGIILDPPAYGRGPSGEKWVLTEGINELFELSSKLLLPDNSFFIANLYSMGFSPLVMENLTKSYFNAKDYELGELYIASNTEQKLPLGSFFRFAL